MKIRYAIEKEIEVPEGTEVKNIDSMIEDICKKENGLDYNWMFKLKDNDSLFYDK